MGDNLHLLPPLVKNGQSQELAEAGQLISAAFSSRTHSGAVFVSNAETPKSTVNGHIESSEKQPLYFFARYPQINPARRKFIFDTFIIFESQKNLIRDAELRGINWDENETYWEELRKLCSQYAGAIDQCWKDLSNAEVDSQDPFNAEHYQTVFACFSLFMVMFVPQFSLEEACVGAELLKWLNLNFIAPSTEEGDLLSSLERPWEDEIFWPYLTRATMRGLRKASSFFIQTLAQHPSEDLQYLSSTMIQLVGSQPTINDYDGEKEFLVDSKRWQSKVKALRIEMDRIPEEDREDGLENWWDRLSDIVGILEGRGDVVKRVCAELGGDWKEAYAAWTIFVEPGLRRRELREVGKEIMDELPPDPTDLEDQIHVALINANFPQILERAASLDPWLSAHMAQFMEPVMDKSPPILESGLSLRQYYVLSYGEYLQSDLRLWQPAVQYMYTCGRVGEQQADEVLLRLPLKSAIFAEDHLSSGEVVGVFQEVSEICAKYHRESIRRSICQIAAQQFVSQRLYGLAVSYLVSAEDWAGLGRVMNRILGEYVTSGPETFTNYALQITPSLLDLGKKQQLAGGFAHQLTFVVGLAQFYKCREEERHEDASIELVSMLRHDIVPRAWYAVLLCDSMDYLQGPTLFFSSRDASELLNKLDEIFVHVSQNWGARDFLEVISTIKGSETEALLCLKSLRLSLARYFALLYQHTS